MLTVGTSMPTLYVRNVPRDLYEALRKRAQSQRRSEVLALLEQFIPTEKELRRRREFALRLKRLRASAPRVPREFPSSGEMIRQDRER
jgi:plasmid stability protein